jgi:hypothetical protein
LEDSGELDSSKEAVPLSFWRRYFINGLAKALMQKADELQKIWMLLEACMLIQKILPRKDCMKAVASVKPEG